MSSLQLCKYVTFKEYLCNYMQTKTSKISTHIKHSCIFDIKIINSPPKHLNLFPRHFRGFHIFQYCKKPYLKSFNFLENLIILNKPNFWLNKKIPRGVLRYGLGLNKHVGTKNYFFFFYSKISRYGLIFCIQVEEKWWKNILFLEENGLLYKIKRNLFLYMLFISMKLISMATIKKSFFFSNTTLFCKEIEYITLFFLYL